MPGSVSVTIDGTKFHTVETVFAMSSPRNIPGVPGQSALHTQVDVWVDLGDDQNCPFTSIKRLFELANVPDRSKFKEIKIEFWKDHARQDVVCAYKFKGWVSRFEVYNPVLAVPAHPIVPLTADRVNNHVLHLQLEPVLNTEGYREVTISN
jgi:hypothetical protein